MKSLLLIFATCFSLLVFPQMHKFSLLKNRQYFSEKIFSKNNFFKQIFPHKIFRSDTLYKPFQMKNMGLQVLAGEVGGLFCAFASGMTMFKLVGGKFREDNLNDIGMGILLVVPSIIGGYMIGVTGGVYACGKFMGANASLGSALAGFGIGVGVTLLTFFYGAGVAVYSQNVGSIIMLSALVIPPASTVLWYNYKSLKEYNKFKNWRPQSLLLSPTRNGLGICYRF